MPLGHVSEPPQGCAPRRGTINPLVKPPAAAPRFPRVQAQGANVASSKMKEAKGQKANDSFEIVARTLLFRPTFTVLAPEEVTSVSSVHALVEPVLKRLEGCESAR